MCFFSLLFSWVFPAIKVPEYDQLKCIVFILFSCQLSDDEKDTEDPSGAAKSKKRRKKKKKSEEESASDSQARNKNIINILKSC